MISIAISNLFDLTTLSNRVYFTIHILPASKVLNLTTEVVKLVKDLISSHPWKNFSQF